LYTPYALEKSHSVSSNHLEANLGFVPKSFTKLNKMKTIYQAFLWNLHVVGLQFFVNTCGWHVKDAAQSLIGNPVDPQNYFSAIFCHLLEYESQINLCPP